MIEKIDPIKILKTRNVKLPNRNTNQDAGIDFYIPYYEPEFLADLIKKNPNANLRYKVEDDKLYITIMPHARILIPTGIHVYIPQRDSALIAANKSGVATKKGLVFTCQVVDSGYSGEVHIGVANVSDAPVIIEDGEKLIQFLHTPIILSNFVETTKEEYEALHGNSVRGANGFGSSDKS